MEQRERVGERVLAEAAIVVEELDQRHVALRVAESDLMQGGKELRGVASDRGAIRSGFGRRAPTSKLQPSCTNGGVRAAPQPKDLDKAPCGAT